MHSPYHLKSLCCRKYNIFHDKGSPFWLFLVFLKHHSHFYEGFQRTDTM